MPRISIYDRPQIELWRKRNRIDPEQIRRLRTRLCKRFLPDEQIAQVSCWRDELKLHWLEVAQECDSEFDGATKLLLRTEQGLLIESVVLRIDTGRTSLCVSSQVGCAAACDFCATGKMGVAKNLSANEIVDQVVIAGQKLAGEDRKIRNIVFMGMGEPFHNERQLFEALDLLISPEIFCHPASRILVSTVGMLKECCVAPNVFPTINQALSLHSVDQAIREQLIPVAKKYPLHRLRETLLSVNRFQTCPVMVEYLMLKDLNDSATDAEELIKWLDGLRVHVNLIPYNPIDDADHLVASPTASIQQFASQLKSAGVTTTTRYSLGKDIAAACGQLVQQENRRIAKSLSL